VRPCVRLRNSYRTRTCSVTDSMYIYVCSVGGVLLLQRGGGATPSPPPTHPEYSESEASGEQLHTIGTGWDPLYRVVPQLR
jgi:hypothetical protein